ncbi:MAG: hypothetical protein ACXACO_20105 [Promethearchaeota archaeon]|jgi:hypothetical protein
MTVNHNVLDMKLKALIHACKDTGNYKKLAVVGFILTSNVVDDISIKLGMRPRRKDKNERLFEYMNSVNNVFNNNLKLHIFKDYLVESIKEVEFLFLKNRGHVPYNYIKILFNVYYTLRKIEPPNLYKNMTGEEIYDKSNFGVLNFFSDRAKRKNQDSDKFKQLILYKIRENEKDLRVKLENKFDSQQIERAIVLKNIKNSLKEGNKHKISFQGSLRDSLDYETTQNIIGKYMLIGGIVITFITGFLIIMEMLLYPYTMQPLNHLLLILFGIALLLIAVYRKYFIKR